MRRREGRAAVAALARRRRVIEVRGGVKTGQLERAFFVVAGSLWPARVAVEMGAPPSLLWAILLCAAGLGLVVVARRDRTLWLDGPRLALALLTLSSVSSYYGRVGGDGNEYFVLAHSLAFDLDLDVGNDFDSFGVVTMRDPGGQPMSRFPLGLPLLWTPVLLLTRIGSRWAAALGAPVETQGFGPQFQAAVNGASFLMALVGLGLTESLIRARAGRAIAALCVVALWLGTPLHFYAVANPFMSHAASAFLASLPVWLWLRVRGEETVPVWLGLGAVGALMGWVRVQDGAFLALPLLDLALRRGKPRFGLLCALLAPALAVAALQAGAWRLMHGPDFLAVAGQGHILATRFHTLDVLFSARHGLLTWTPLYVLALVGLGILAVRAPRLGGLFLALVFICAAVNSRMTDWWGGDAFGQRRLLGLTPVFGVGLAAFLCLVRRRPLLVSGAALLPLIVWNQQLAGIYNSETISRKSQPLSLDRVAQAQVDVLVRRLLRFSDHLPRSAFVLVYDNLRGVWLDEGPRSMRGRLDLGDEIEAFPVVGHGWTAPQSEAGVGFRRANVARAWLRVPIQTPADFVVLVRARAELRQVPVTLKLEANGGSALGQAPLTAAWQEHRFRWPREQVLPGVNELALVGSPTPVEVIPDHQGRNSAFAVEWIRFERQPESRPPG